MSNCADTLFTLPNKALTAIFELFTIYSQLISAKYLGSAAFLSWLTLLFVTIKKEKNAAVPNCLCTRLYFFTMLIFTFNKFKL